MFRRWVCLREGRRCRGGELAVVLHRPLLQFAQVVQLLPLLSLQPTHPLGRLEAGEPLVVVDVRPIEEYRAAHLPGAVSIPLDELEQRLRELPQDRQIVAYCRGPYCAFAPEAVRKLRAHNYAARHLMDGLPEWAAAGRRTLGGTDG